MGLLSYKVGKSWENDILNCYQRKGYATFKLSTDIDGTICDILCIKNNGVISIEAKHIKGHKLYYESSGLKRKRDELNNYISKNNNVYIFIKSDIDGEFMLDWKEAEKIFNEKGYVTVQDGIKINTEV